MPPFQWGIEMSKFLIRVILFGFFSIPLYGWSESLDHQLREKFKEYKVSALNPITETNPALFELGKFLFFDKILSSDKNISCSTCHSTKMGLSSGSAFGIGNGGIGAGDQRRATDRNQYTFRHVPTLFNLGGQTSQFWDARVTYDWQRKVLSTPEPGISGRRPYLTEVARALTLANRQNGAEDFTALAAQTLFPIATLFEMRSVRQPNLERPQYWDSIVKNLIGSGKTPSQANKIYRKMFSSAFGVRDPKQINIGHVGVALGFFIRNAFTATETSFDQYLRGKEDALSLDEKRGALIFYSGKAKCAECHSGPYMTTFDVRSIGVPQAGLGVAADGDDYGRYHINFVVPDKYKFKTPQLRNLSVTAPYTHSGLLKTLSEVVDHYNNVNQSLLDFDFTRLPDIERVNSVENRSRDAARYNSVEPEFRIPLQLTEEEKKLLVLFLEKSLTDRDSIDALKQFSKVKVPSGLAVDH